MRCKYGDYSLICKTLFFDETNRKNRFENMELRQLKYFLKAKELLNFTDAEKALNISQSTLSRQIKQLEDELTVPLFNRIGKRITLTEAGYLYSEYALQSINRINEDMRRTIMIISLRDAYEKKAVKKLYEMLGEI